MKLFSRYLYRILVSNLLLGFIIFSVFGFLMALGVHAATSEQLPLDARRMNSGTIPTKSSLISSPQIVAQSDTQLQNGQSLYQAGQFLAAANIWKAAASSFQSKGDILNQALVLSYLALAYQQLGQPQSTEATMSEAVGLIANQTLPEAKFILAQILNMKALADAARAKGLKF